MGVGCWGRGVELGVGDCGAEGGLGGAGCVGVGKAVEAVEELGWVGRGGCGEGGLARGAVDGYGEVEAGFGRGVLRDGEAFDGGEVGREDVGALVGFEDEGAFLLGCFAGSSLGFCQWAARGCVVSAFLVGGVLGDFAWVSAGLAEQRFHDRAELLGVVDHCHTNIFQNLELIRGALLASGRPGTGVTHDPS